MEALEIVQELLDSVLDGPVAESIMNKERKACLPSYAASSCLADAMTVISLLTSSAPRPVLLTATNEEEPEPVAPAIDAHAPGAVPTRPRPEKPIEIPEPQSPNRVRRGSVGSVGSVARSLLRMNKNSSRLGSEASGSNAGGIAKSGSYRSGSSGAKSGGGTLPVRSHRRVVSNQNKSPRPVQDRAAMAAAAATARKAAAEAARAEAEAAVANAKAELRGKPYAYDSDGNMVPIAPPPSEKLPAPFVTPQVRVTGDEEEEVPSGKERRVVGKKNSKKAVGVRKSKTRMTSSLRKKSDGKGPLSSELAAAMNASLPKGGANFKANAAGQPPVVSTLQPAAGVVLSESGATKRGPERPSSGTHRTRSEAEAAPHFVDTGLPGPGGVEQGITIVPASARVSARVGMSAAAAAASRIGDAVGSGSVQMNVKVRPIKTVEPVLGEDGKLGLTMPQDWGRPDSAVSRGHGPPLTPAKGALGDSDPTAPVSLRVRPLSATGGTTTKHASASSSSTVELPPIHGSGKVGSLVHGPPGGVSSSVRVVHPGPRTPSPAAVIRTAAADKWLRT